MTVVESKEVKPEDKQLSCCTIAGCFIPWRLKHYVDGPDEDGWAINLSPKGAPSWERIGFCPFCGEPVE